MIRGLSALILHTMIYLIQTTEVPHRISLTEVELGGNVTFQCPVSEKGGKFFYWYKQSLGYMAQTVAAVIVDRITVSEPFKDSHFTVTATGAQYFLTIRNVSKEDEATYFCQSIAAYSQSFVNGIFLTVYDRDQQKSVDIRQSPETASVQPGDSVTLQCSLLSRDKENRVQCPDQHSVYWFRAESGESHPSVIYTHRNSSDEEEKRSCVYSLSKTIRDSSDSGTYYCAVVTCGEILLGEGTQVDTRHVSDSGSDLGPVVLVLLVLGVLLTCCVTVIVILIFCVNQRKVCEHCNGAISASHHPGHYGSTVNQPNDPDGEAKAANDAALDLTMRKVRRRKKERESPEECVFSVVCYRNQQHPSL